jgi:hypothetical protein
MRNKIIILLAVITISALFAIYMMPKMEQRNNLDRLALALGALERDLPENKIVWFVAKDISDGPPEIYYKTQFILAPRTVKKSDNPGDVPSGAKVIIVDDLTATGNELSIDNTMAESGLFSINRDGFTVTILTKK